MRQVKFFNRSIATDGITVIHDSINSCEFNKHKKMRVVV